MGFFISRCFPPTANLDSAWLGSHRGPKGDQDALAHEPVLRVRLWMGIGFLVSGKRGELARKTLSPMVGLVDRTRDLLTGRNR